MGIKERLADEIIKHLSKEQKAQMLEKFREKYKDADNLKELEEEMKERLGL